MSTAKPVKKIKSRAKLLTKIREASGLNVTEFGRKFDLSRVTIHRYESGKIRPEVKQAYKYLDLAHELGMNEVRLEDILES